MIAEQIRVHGTVQGVGFRPAVWRYARECGVSGSVLNDAEGVLIHAFGPPEAIDALAGRLETQPPPLSKVEAVIRRVVESTQAPEGFRIVSSADGVTATNVAADAATCPACLADIRDPANRRFRYPFTNCTHCGPRLSIVRHVPYDRSNTSMAAFDLCDRCRREYDDPADRRFHAQPNACPDCGPQLWLEDADGQTLATRDGALVETVAIVERGGIVAIKGLGGFHLACDAANADAVAALRRRKRRYGKALALMVRDIGVLRRFAKPSAAEIELLESAAAPIVVLEARGEPLPDALAPGQDTLGFMLPYTPLHHLLMESFEQPLVMTSGNASDEPQVIDNAEARRRLSGIADAFLLHDRDIVNRLDDSVTAVVGDGVQVLRRGRGYAPEPVTLPAGFEDADGVLAMGGELKNTFCLVSRGRAILSQHIGDMEDARALADARENLDLYRRLYDFEPRRVAVDRHPDYLPSRDGHALGGDVVEIQHHHAHIAACLLEHGRPADTGPVLGIVLDGLGFGADGSLWGGEFLLADYRRARRLAHFVPVALPGGERAMREPWRNAWAHLDMALGWSSVRQNYPDLDFVRWASDRPVETLAAMCERGINSPPASSAGRLFDAVAAVLDLSRETQQHEAEAAMQLEALARRAASGATGAPYPVDVDWQDGTAELSWRSLWRAILKDLHDGVCHERIAARFHTGLADALAALALELARREDADTVVLSGGVFQNRVLSELLLSELTASGIQVLMHQRIPANDGGLALGQAAIAAATA